LQVGLVNTGSYVITTVLFQQLLKNFTIVVQAAQRAVQLQRGYSQVQLQVLSVDTKFSEIYGYVAGHFCKIVHFLDVTHYAIKSVLHSNPPSHLFSFFCSEPGYKFETDIGFLFSNERIRTSVNEVERLHRILYLAAVDSGDSNLIDEYLKPLWRTEDLVPGKYVDRDHKISRFRNQSLSNLGLEYVAKQRTFWWYPPEQVRAYDLDTFWLENNGPFVLLDAFNTSIFTAARSSEGVATIVRISNLAVLVSACALFAIVSIAMMLPSIIFVQREKGTVYSIFRDVPVRVIRYLRDMISQKILQARGLNEEEGADKIEGDDALAFAANAGTAGDGLSDDDSNKKSSSRTDGRFCACCRKNRVDDSHGHRHHKRKFRNASNASRLIIEMLWPLAAYVIFYASTYVWRQDVVEYASYARNEVLWAAQAEVVAPNIAYLIRNAIMYNEPKWVQMNIDMATTQVLFMKDLVNGLCCTYTVF
jgi:hypothetical protein